jgi:hypothetical protein
MRAPLVTWLMTASVLAAVSTISGGGLPRRPAANRNDTSQAGSSRSAMVKLALTRSRLHRSARRAAVPVSSGSASFAVAVRAAR